MNREGEYLVKEGYRVAMAGSYEDFIVQDFPSQLIWKVRVPGEECSLVNKHFEVDTLILMRYVQFVALQMKLIYIFSIIVHLLSLVGFYHLWVGCLIRV